MKRSLSDASLARARARRKLPGARGRTAGQVAVRLDYRTRIARQTATVNMVVSGYRVAADDLAARLRGGLLAIVIGSLG
jgi:hypothetical protein